MKSITENTNYVNYLIELSQSGRKNAFFDLCEINLKNVFTTVYRLLADYELSKKVTLKALLDAWDKIRTYDYKIAFALWLKGFAVRAAISNLFDRLNINRNYERSNFNNYSQDEKNLEHLIMNLDYYRRIIFVLHDLEGYNYEDIAKFLGLDPSNKLGFIDEIKTILMETREYLINAVCK